METVIPNARTVHVFSNPCSATELHSVATSRMKIRDFVQVSSPEGCYINWKRQGQWAIGKHFLGSARPPTPPVIVTPPIINLPPYRAFELTCISSDGSRVNAIFKGDRSPVDKDPRFRIIQYNSSTVTVIAPYGLRDTDDVQIE